MTEQERREELVKLVCALASHCGLKAPGGADKMVEEAVKFQIALDKACPVKPPK